jgi:GT2 family glycosyltransferase
MGSQLMPLHPLVSIIVPSRNEGKTVASCLDSIISSHYPHKSLEVVVVDGDSEDETRAIIKQYANRYELIKLIDNPQKTTPVGLNMGIRMAAGQYIIILSSHSKIESDFIRRNIEEIEKTDADCVGGRIITLPTQDDEMGLAIALSLSTPFGVGNSSFRTGVDNTRYVDTVPYGCYKKDVFCKVGLFNEHLIRNQDIEFNLRLKRQGGKILLVPGIVSYYFARSTIKDFWKQSFANGFWVTYGLGFSRLPFSVRHLVPLVFLISLVTLIAASFYNKSFISLALLIIALYLAINTAVSVHLASCRGLKTCLCLMAAFGTLHFGYGVGSLWGLVKLGHLIATKLSAKD